MKVPVRSPFRKSFPWLFRPSRSSLLAAGKVSRWRTSRDPAGKDNRRWMSRDSPS
ncbi:hypothetical protein Tco_0473706, partial [Tanacetum coccineum]